MQGTSSFLGHSGSIVRHFWPDVWWFHSGFVSINLQRQHPSLQGNVCVSVKSTKLQKNISGAANTSWNRGGPVSQVVPRGVSPCPDIGGMQKYEEFAKKINIGYAMSKVCYEKENWNFHCSALSSTALTWTSCWLASAMAWWPWPPRRCSRWTQSCSRSEPWRQPTLPTSSWTCRGLFITIINPFFISNTCSILKLFDTELQVNLTFLNQTNIPNSRHDYPDFHSLLQKTAPNHPSSCAVR